MSNNECLIDENAEVSKEEKSGSYFWFSMRMMIAVGIIAWLVLRNYQSFVDALKGYDYRWLFPAAALYLLHLCAGALRWRMLLRVQNIDISYLETFSLTLQGFFFSMVIPGGALGGDVVKGAFIVKRSKKGSRLAGAFTILMDRVLGMITLFSLAGVLGVMSYGFLSKVEGGVWFLVASIVLGLIGITAAVGLFMHRQLERISQIGWGVNLADRLTKGAVHRMMDAMDCFRDAWPVLIKCMLLTLFFIHLLLSAVVYCIARGAGESSEDPKSYILSTTLANAAGSIPITPSGAGTRDAIMIRFFVSAGFDKGVATATALVFSGIMLVFNLLGGLFFIFGRIKSVKQ
jgi:uncharacterized protein (TIRG00374 family)